jgi:hypothetical protein
MVQQVPIVGILMIVHGGLVSLMGLLYAILGPTMFALVQMDKSARADDRTMMAVMSVGYIGCGLLVLAVGVLHILSGIQCLRFRNRILILTTLFCNIPVLFTCYCALTGIGMTVYGLIVMFNKDVAAAFDMAAQGASPAQIKDAFDPRRRFDRPDDVDRYRRPDDVDDRGRPWQDDRGPDDRIQPG